MNSPVQERIALGPHTSLQVGGNAQFFAELHDTNDLPNLCEFALSHTGTMPFILGGGSNVVIAEGTLTRLVVKMLTKGIDTVETGGSRVLVSAAAGENWDDLVSYTTKHGLYGLENLSGIPGTVGAAPVQNINAYGTSVAESISSVTVFDVTSGEEKELAAAACNFSYRESVFKQKAGQHYVITKVTFALSRKADTQMSYQSASQSIARILKEKQIHNPTPEDVRNAVLSVRKNIGMLPGQFRSAGSFFKNTIVSIEQFEHVRDVVEERFPELGKKYMPWFWEQPNNTVKISTAFLLECSPYNKTTYGTKRERNVGISPLHSLSIVTEPGAHSNDVKEFADKIIASVEKIFSLTLEPEVLFIS